MVREWDPKTASADELRSMLDSLNAVLMADLPDDPLWQESYLREYLAETMPGERRISWLAEEPAGRVMGHANVLLLGDIGVVELLIHPKARRAGLAREMLAQAARKTYHEGFSVIGAEVVGGTPAVTFFESVGFVREYTETRSVLRLNAVDWLSLGEMARGIGAGYRIEFCPGGPPDDLLDAYAKAKAELREIDDGDLDLRPSSYDPQRLRASLDCLHRRGMQPYIVLAIHDKTGDVAGLTEVVVPAQHPTRADQYDTIVVPRHRGYGLGRALKARMLFELRAAEPQLLDVQTWNAANSTAMLRVNTDLGFREDREWREYEADVSELIQRLKTA
jgi:GNAT superfamily N-acetyltransferase